MCHNSIDMDDCTTKVDQALSSVGLSSSDDADESIVSKIADLTGLIIDAASYGSGFHDAYKSINDIPFGDDVRSFYSCVATTSPVEAVAVCEQLSDDIKKAIAAMNAPRVDSLPSVCNGGTMQVCSEGFINETKENIKNLRDEIFKSICQLRQKRMEMLIAQSTLDTCTVALDQANHACLTTPAPTPVPAPVPAPAPTCPTIPTPVCPIPTPPTPVCPSSCSSMSFHDACSTHIPLPNWSDFVPRSAPTGAVGNASFCAMDDAYPNYPYN